MPTQSRGHGTRRVTLCPRVRRRGVASILDLFAPKRVFTLILVWFGSLDRRNDHITLCCQLLEQGVKLSPPTCPSLDERADGEISPEGLVPLIEEINSNPTKIRA